MRPQEKAEACRIALAEMRKRHRAFGCYDECGHDHKETGGGVIEVEDIGLVCAEGLLYEVCHECGLVDGEPQDWTEDTRWPCDAARLLDYAEARLKGVVEQLAQRPRFETDPNEDRAAARADDAEAEIESLYQFLHRKE